MIFPTGPGNPKALHCDVWRYVLAFVVLLAAGDARAWVYPEHRSIALLAIQRLSPEHRAVLDRLWAAARTGHEDRLTLPVIDIAQGEDPTQVDYAAWMGLAGDHSCSPEDMITAVLGSDWVLRVADVAARLETDLKKAGSPSKTSNSIRNSDIRLQRADPDYATRAGSNNVHFLLARQEADAEAMAYFARCLRSGAELNALGAYAWFHTLALLKAARSGQGDLSEEQRSSLALAALADEAFALHFLEDVFASGHVAGTWGNAASRKGTHDHYNERGLEVLTWDGTREVLAGDAHMRPADADIASAAVRSSLEQMLNAAQGLLSPPPDPQRSVPSNPDTLDVCANNYMPPATWDMDLLSQVLMATPIPGLASGLGELPRFRSELGPFFGASSGIGAYAVQGGFGEGQDDIGAIATIGANLMFGFGLDGVLNNAGDGLVFVQAGWRQDATSSSQFTDANSPLQANSVTSTIPARSAFDFRLRLPFWLIPGDMIIAAPILALASPKTMQRMAVAAGNGGAIPWQSGISTPLGRFQFVLGREVGLSLYGHGEVRDALVIPNVGNETYLVTYRSAKWDFPWLEYRPTRSFSQDQSAILKVQLSFGLDVPYNEEVIAPVDRDPIELKSVWYGGFRIVFDWRRYL